jgi:hypothetical protein
MKYGVINFYSKIDIYQELIYSAKNLKINYSVFSLLKVE